MVGKGKEVWEMGLRLRLILLELGVVGGDKMVLGLLLSLNWKLRFHSLSRVEVEMSSLWNIIRDRGMDGGIE